MLSFKTVARTIRTHYLGILNFFNNRATNAATEAFNAKMKTFRNALRGVRDIEFFSIPINKIICLTFYAIPQLFNLIL
ncbi:transposase [Chitinophaga solisilvae]|uniref:transposase n=1 Tax=Chitinophaga solisilvae TaxID=1233460 RepID=UPI0019228D9C